jgi:hypothetical protein
MRNLLLIAVLLALTVLQQGCQLDIQGPSMSAKVFQKNENNGDVYKSRGSGMSGGNSYASNGGQMRSNGDGGAVYSSGNKVDKALRTFFKTK